MKWRLVIVAGSDFLFADIYEGERLIVERIDFSKATKIVQAHNKDEHEN